MFKEPPWGHERVAAIERVLAPGELLVAKSQCYQDIWHERWQPRRNRTEKVFGGLHWQQAVLTNANFWLTEWRTELVRTGFISRRVDTLAEVAHQKTIPIRQVASLTTQRVGLAPQPRLALRRVLGARPEHVSVLTLTYPGGALAVQSPYVEFENLVQNLQRAITGASLAGASGSVAHAVTKLAELRSDGLLTEQEFERAKAGFVGRTVELSENSAGLIRQLAQLRDAGVLTESEFRLKKWDVLSRPG